MGELQLRDALAAAVGDSPFDTSRVGHAAEKQWGDLLPPSRPLCARKPPQTLRTHPQARMARQHFDMWINTVSG